MLWHMLNRIVDGLAEAAGRRLGIDGRYFARSGFWSVASEVVQAAMGLVLAAAFTRWSTPQVFGQFQLLMSLLAVGAAVSIKGLETVVVRDAAAGRDGVLMSAVALRWRWSLLSMPIFLGVAAYYRWRGEAPLAAGLLVAAVVAPAYYTVQLWQSFLKGKRRFDFFSQLISGRAVAVLLAMLLLLRVAPQEPVVLFFVYAGLHAISGAAFLWVVRRRIVSSEVSADWRSYSYFLSATGLVKLIAAHVDKILVGTLYSPQVLAVYSIALILPNGVLLLLKGLFETTIPKLAMQATLPFRQLLLSVGIGAVAAAVTVAAILGFTVPLFGPAYASAIPLALIATAAVLLQPLVQLLYNFAQVRGRRRAVLLASTGTPLTKFVLLAVFAPLFREVGVAVVYGLMSVVWAVWVLAGLRIDVRRRVVH